MHNYQNKVVLAVDDFSVDVYGKQYNTNVCCVKNNLPKWFYGEMIEPKKCNSCTTC